MSIKKQTMINGVDVSGCIHYKNQTCIANYLFTNIPFSEAKCKISPNCHYKQLKRKENELKAICEEFDIEYIKDKETGEIHSRCNKLLRKEQECEKYKKCINNIRIINKDLLNDLCDNCGWHNTDGCDPDEDYVCESLIKIKQIINEVENGINNYSK